MLSNDNGSFQLTDNAICETIQQGMDNVENERLLHDNDTTLQGNVLHNEPVEALNLYTIEELLNELLKDIEQVNAPERVESGQKRTCIPNKQIFNDHFVTYQAMKMTEHMVTLSLLKKH